VVEIEAKPRVPTVLLQAKMKWHAAAVFPSISKSRAVRVVNVPEEQI
jgi:hypothetical protein